ncbi:Retrotransposon gag domain [Arabidopsis thaliana x Arabidopsis arenosa]|uniref:Retrotransposon gag domain n=1 Tax=Arabidopsis thaliana x Arabidopsis arenosa TaxID=1240361 RepID=A0A8T2F0A5_9BRAS|nr:Retrotransposon gag domain [Arabidopsis thaliana x Arabidopsis arenosa]
MGPTRAQRSAAKQRVEVPTTSAESARNGEQTVKYVSGNEHTQVLVQLVVGVPQVGDRTTVSAAVLQGIRDLFEEIIQNNFVVSDPEGVAVVKPVPMEIPSYWEMLRFMRDLDIETFNGGTDPVKAYNWRNMLECKFKSMRCPVEFWRDLASCYLRGEAQEWWERVKQREQVGCVDQWSFFKEEFTRRYLPEETIDDLEMKFLRLQQGTKTVREYEKEFHSLERFERRKRGEHELIHKFISGLRVDIRLCCHVRDFDNMIDLVEKAASLEIGLEEEARYKRIAQEKEAMGSYGQTGHRRLSGMRNNFQHPLRDKCWLQEIRKIHNRTLVRMKLRNSVTQAWGHYGVVYMQ